MSRQATAIDTNPNGDQRLLTVYDQGEEKTFITNKTTIGAALREQNIVVEPVDAVEPVMTTQLSAKSYAVNIYRARSVIVDDKGVKTQVLTAKQSPKEIMASVGAPLYPEDTTAFELAKSPLSDGGAGLRLSVDRATVFQLSLYGKSFEARSQAATVGDMLREKDVTLGPSDGQSVPDSTPLVAGMSVVVWRDGKQTITQEEAIPKTVEEIKDADRDYGVREVKTAGTDGAKNVTYEIDMKGGKEVSRTVIASVTIREPVKEVIIIGTRFKGAYTTPSENETITWTFLTGKGLSREQTAGIMGNLQQEHGFNTTGDGLAQWTGGRKATLLSRPDPYSIHTQLDFMWYELTGPYASVLTHIQAQTTVEGSVRVFQNEYERCGICAESKRIQYAYNILASH
ncbi:MAG: phage tail tip lysozyme [Candidatus Saccharimonadales bacterium]